MTVEQRRRRNAGPLLSGGEIARAAVRTLALRLAPWLDEAARQQGLEIAVPRPHAVVLGSAIDETAGGYPAVAVTHRAIRIRQHSDRELDGEFQLRVLAAVADDDRDEAFRIAAIYEVAIQACLVNTLGEYAPGILHDITPMQSGVEPRTPAGAACDVLFTVTGGPLLSRDGYLAVPPEGAPPGPDDQGDQGTIEDVELVTDPHPAGGTDGDDA
jgi:hypothetical protein